jgi:hypothetical protein
MNVELKAPWFVAYLLCLLLPIFAPLLLRLIQQTSLTRCVTPFIFWMSVVLLLLGSLVIVGVIEYTFFNRPENAFADNIWAALYFFILIGPLAVAVLSDVKDPNFYVSVVSSLALVFLPSVCIWYLKTHQVAPTTEIEITLNVYSMLFSCTNIIVMFFVTAVFRSYRYGHPVEQPIHKLVVTYEAVLFVTGFVALVLGAANYEWFVQPENYSQNVNISWIRPGTVKCPMNYLRTFIGVLLAPSLFFPWNHKRPSE